MLAILLCGCRNEPAAASRPVAQSFAADAALTQTADAGQPATDSGQLATDSGQTATDSGQLAILDAHQAEPGAWGDITEDEQIFIDGIRTTPPERVLLQYEVDLTETACSPVVRVNGFHTRDCERTVGIAHAATSTGWANESGRVEFSPFSVTHDGDALSSVATACEQWVETKRSPEFCKQYSSTAYYPGWSSYILRPTSLVGPIVSFAIESARDGSGTVNSYAEVAHSFDVRTDGDAAFDALVTTDSLLAALKADSYLKNALGEKLQNATTLQDVWKLWGVDDFWRFGGYYFHRWSTRRGEVAMRIPFLEKHDGLGPNNLRSLGIWVKPKPEFRATFEAAARGEGGFLGGR